MADEKLSQLPFIADPLVGSDLIYLVRGGVSYQGDIDQILAIIPTVSVAWGDITGVLGNQTDLQAELDAKVDAGPIGGGGLTMNENRLVGRSSGIGSGPVGEITLGPGLSLSGGGVLDVTGGAAVWGSITGTLADQSDLSTALGLKAPLASPTFTGTPAAPTAAPGTNTTQIATTAFVLANAPAGTVTSISSANADLNVSSPTTTPVLTVVSAPKLTTARNINGVAFDGTGNITVTAAAGTLTGTTLNSTVVTSSLTAVGALASGSLATGFVVGGVTMTLGSDAANDVYYRNGSGVLTRLANGTTGQFLAATTGAAPSWSTPSGAGTVTHTGNLTANAIVLGNGTADTKVSTGFTTDGTSVLTVGVVGASTSGAIFILGKTSGSLKLAVNDATARAVTIGLSAQTTGNVTLAIPDMAGVSDTFVFNTLAATLSNKTLSGAAFDLGITTVSGAFNVDFSSFTGTFKTTTGATTLGSSATVNGVDLAPEIKQNVQTGNYTLVLADANRQIYAGSGGAATWTIPANASVAFPIGTTIVFCLVGAITARTIAITTDTLTWLPTQATGSRTLAAGGLATAMKVTSTMWIITGVGLT